MLYVLNPGVGLDVATFAEAIAAKRAYYEAVQRVPGGAHLYSAKGKRIMRFDHHPTPHWYKVDRSNIAVKVIDVIDSRHKDEDAKST